MKTTKLIITFLAIVACSAPAAFQTYGNGFGSVYKDPDIPPVFRNVDEYFRNHVVYPPEAWRENRQESVFARLIIDKEGNVGNVEFMGEVHPELQRELTRVLDGMHWYPATKNGYKVAVEYVLEIPVAGRTFLDSGETPAPIPFGWKERINNTRKEIKRIYTKQPMIENDGRLRLDRDFADVIGLMPEESVTAIAWQQLLNSEGNPERGQAVIDSCLKAYHSYYFNPDSAMVAEKEAYAGRPWFSGRRELGVSVMRALQHTVNGNGDAAISDAIRLAETRMIDGDICDAPTNADRQAAEDRIKRFQLCMVYGYGGIRTEVGVESPIWNIVSRANDYRVISDSISAWSGSSYIGSVDIEQMRRLIEQERNALKNGKMAKGEVKNLFGVKAMLIWMREGNEGMKRYLAEVRQGAPSKELQKYLDRLEKNLDSNAAVMADRHGVMQSLVCLLPPQGADDDARKEFYNRRRAAEKVFPIAWMMK